MGRLRKPRTSKRRNRRDEKSIIEGFGAWYGEKQGETGDPWHRTLIDPGLFERIGPVARGTRFLDVGCGNGYIARRFARLGAQVVAVDASQELIRWAVERERARPLGIEYHLADAAHLRMIRAGSVDIAVSNMAIMDIEDAEAAIGEIGRVVRPDGRFVFSISHPCFDVDMRSGWQIEQKLGSARVFRKVTGYRQPHAEKFPWPLYEGHPVVTVGYHRPLSWYSQVLRRSGFVILELGEPAPQPEFRGGSVAREWIEEIPLHLVFETRRVRAISSN